MKSLPKTIAQIALAFAFLSAITTPAEARRVLGTPVVVVVEEKEIVSGS